MSERCIALVPDGEMHRPPQADRRQATIGRYCDAHVPKPDPPPPAEPCCGLCRDVLRRLLQERVGGELEMEVRG